MNHHVRKKSLSALLALVLLVSLLVPAAAGRAGAEELPSDVLFSQNFEEQSIGETPAGWTLPNRPPAVDPAPDPYVLQATVAELTGGGQGLKLEKNAKSTASYTIRRQVQTDAAQVVFSYRFLAEQTNAAVYLPSLQYGASQIKFALVNGQFSYTKQQQSNWTSLQPYEPGRWYEVRIMLDTEQGIYEVYLDGGQLLASEPGGAGPALSEFYLGIYRDSIGTAYFDDFLVTGYRVATSAAFEQESYELQRGEHRQLRLVYEPADAVVQGATWSTSDASVVQVSQTGVVTAVAAGIATITAQPAGGLPPVMTTVQVTDVVRTSGDILAETYNSATAGSPPTGWSLPSKPAPVAPVPSPFVLETVVAPVPGEADNQALRFIKNGKTAASYSITRPVSSTSTKTLVTYRVKAEQTDAVIYLPSFNNGAQVKFALNGGQFSYMKEGASAWTNIQPYANGEWYEVRIMLDAEAGEFDLYIDGQLKLSREPGGQGGPLVSFYLGMYKDSAGTVYFDDFHIYSYKPATGVAFAQASYELAKDRQLQLPLVFEPVDATVQSAAWSSSDPEVATVSASGVVTGLKPGTTTITAEPLEAVGAATTTVHVFEVPMTGITVEELTGPVPAGSTVYLQATAQPEDTTDERLYWGSEHPEVATVDSYGELTAIGPGTATVYAANADGTIRGEIEVTVTSRSVQQELYVSPDGDDDGAGTLADPFQTIARAQAEVRTLNDSMTGDIIVHLRGGTYVLDEALVWGPEDSGTHGYFVTYRNYNGEEAVISGGQQVGGWQLHDAEQGIYKAEVGELETRQLFVDGIRAVRARSEGGLTMPTKTATGYTSEDTAMTSWTEPDELEFIYHEQWTNSRAGVASIALVDGKAQFTMKEPAWNAVTNKGLTSASVPVYYENAYELLDEAGEWYYSRAAGELYYKPQAWEDLATAEVIAPVLEELAIIRGASADEPVRNIVFDGLAFRYTTWMRPSTDAGHADAQNNHLRYPGSPDQLPDAAIRVELANSVSFVNNEFAKLGVTAIRMENGVQNSRTYGNRFYDLSGSALNIGSPDSNDRNVFHPADPRLIMKNNDVLNNVIHDIGVDYKSSSAVSAGYPVDMDISHNEMFSLPYSGTHTGYGWAKDFDPVTRNMSISNNLIYDLMGMGLYDGGAIYSLGTTGGTAEDKNRVTGNYIRNQMDIGAPLYTDEGSAYWRFDHNVIDLIDSGEWHSSKRWAQIWAPTIHDVDFINNYTTELHAISNGYDNRFENNQVFPDGNWPEEAQQIIAAAGVQPGYDRTADTVVRRWGIEPLTLGEGDTDRIQLQATDGKDRPMSLAASEIYYASDAPEVATIDAEGNVTGVAIGQARLTVHIVNGGMLRTLHTNVFVGDTLTEVRLEGTAGKTVFLQEGQEHNWPARGYTAFGNVTELEDVHYASSRPEVATVSANGTVKAVAAGDTVLTLTGGFQGGEVTTRYLLRVIGPGTLHAYAFAQETSGEAGWYVSPTTLGNVQSGEGSVTISTPSGGHAVYQGRQYIGELLDFDMQINGTGGWYALMLGKQSPTAGYVNDDNYIVVISASAIELHRYNDGKRTVIYGNLAGYESQGGDAIPNTMFPYQSRHRVQLGTTLHEDGVRIVLKVDGETVIDYVDADELALDAPGYFGLISRTGSISLWTPEAESRLAGLAIEPFGTLKAGEEQELTVHGLYDHGGPAELEPAELSLTSSDERVAVVAADGTLRALQAGSSVLGVTYGELEASYALTVVAAGGGDGGGPGGNDGGNSGGGNGGGGIPPLPGGPAQPPVEEEPEVPESPVVRVELDVEQDADVRTATEADGQTVKRIAVRDEALIRAFAEAGTLGAVMLNVEGDDPIVRLVLLGKALQDVIQGGAPGYLEVQTAAARYRLPLSLLREVSDEAEVVLTIAQTAAAYTEDWQAYLSASGMRPLVDVPVAFHLEIDGVPYHDFGGVYVERSIRLSDGVDARQASAVWMDAEGHAHFVPHQAGEGELWIKSPHNSVYGAVGYEKSFGDLTGHWAQTEIERLAGKLIVQGTSANHFSPGTAVTRAEFAALLVRALGLAGMAASQQSSSPAVTAGAGGLGGSGGPEAMAPHFGDVEASAWYADAVATAAATGLVTGYEDGSFRPAQTITREQMAVMLVRALAYAGVTGTPDPVALDRFDDRGDISAWARDAAATVLGQGLMQGMTENVFGAQSPATRAQSAVMLHRLLQQVDFID